MRGGGAGYRVGWRRHGLHPSTRPRPLILPRPQTPMPAPHKPLPPAPTGVWDVDNVLSPTYSASAPAALPADFKPYTLSIEVQDVPGVLNQVRAGGERGGRACGRCCALDSWPASCTLPALMTKHISCPTCRSLCPPAPLQVSMVFSRRGYNVQSLAVGPSEREGLSRIVMVVPGKVRAVGAGRGQWGQRGRAGSRVGTTTTQRGSCPVRGTTARGQWVMDCHQPIDCTSPLPHPTHTSVSPCPPGRASFPSRSLGEGCGRFGFGMNL